MSENCSSRRILLHHEGISYQMFSFTQDKRESDGSIYISYPMMEKTKVIRIVNKGAELILATEDIAAKGKLSVHGSGMVGLREYDQSYRKELVVNGNFLLNVAQGEIRPRHLFTGLMPIPSELPGSPAGNRKCDYIVDAKNLKPQVWMFFALPGITQLNVNPSFRFHTDDIETIAPGEPAPDMSWGYFGLTFHNIFWMVYRTRMAWPTVPQIFYHDGYHVPMYLGGQDAGRFSLVAPTYGLEGNILSIGIDCTNEENAT